MKYIRTKDGRIIELPKHPSLMLYGDNVVLDLHAIKQGKVGHEIIDSVIEKQADTIEELCDEFVCHKETCKDLLIAKSYRKAFNEDLYGAIWTDKGLIYVAKMNDKGVLELL